MGSIRCCIIALFALFSILLTEMPLSAAGDSAAPIQIEADRMESSQKENEVLFFGNVVARQADIVIYSDRMAVHYEDSRKDGDAYSVNQNVREIQATGNTKIVKEDWVSTGDHMTYFADSRKVLLTGNAKAWQDKNMVTGDRIVLYLDEGKSVIEGGTDKKERVKAFIYPENSSQPKK